MIAALDTDVTIFFISPRLSSGSDDAARTLHRESILSNDGHVGSWVLIEEGR